MESLLHSLEKVTAPSRNFSSGRAAEPPGQPFSGLSDRLLRALPEAVFAASIQGTISAWNQAASEVFGYDAADVVGQPVDFLAGAGSTILPLIERASREGRMLRDQHLRCRRKDGREFDVELTMAAALEDPPIVVITARDISREKRDERRAAAEYAVTRALSESATAEQAYKRVLGAVASEMDWKYADLWVTDNKNDLFCRTTWSGTDVSLTTFDARNHRLKLKPGEGLPGRVFKERAPVWIEDVTRDSNFPRFSEALQAGLHSGVAVPIIVRDELFGVMEFFSREVRVRDDAVLRTLLAIGSELGQYILRLRAQDELQASEQRFRTLAQSASDTIVTLDESSRIRFANDAVLRMFGYEPTELLGRRMAILMPKRFRTAHRVGFKRYRATGQKRIPWSAVELVGLHRDGHEIPIEISFGEFRTDTEHFFTGVMRDITDRKEAMVELQKRTAEAEAASKAKSEFLAAMSHELRTPLQAIIGYTGLIQGRLSGPLTEQQAHQLSRVQLSAEHLLQLIDQVLDASRADAGTLQLNIEAVDVDELIKEACAAVRPLAQSKKLRLECATPTGLESRYVHADGQRTYQALLNLLTNAVKFTESGTVSVSASIDAEKNSINIDVVDTGIGISPEEAERIFDPFYQVESAMHRRAPGIGLGLSIAKRLVEAMAGAITVTSAKQEGSTFRITLPLTAGRPAK